MSINDERLRIIFARKIKMLHQYSRNRRHYDNKSHFPYHKIMISKIKVRKALRINRTKRIVNKSQREYRRITIHLLLKDNKYRKQFDFNFSHL